jgi:hypothetical protein
VLDSTVAGRGAARYELIHPPHTAVEKDRVKVGNARPITALTVSEVQALGESIDARLKPGQPVNPIDLAIIRDHVSRTRVAAKVSDHRNRLIRMLTGDVSDPAYIEQRFALAGVPVAVLDDIGPEAA